MLSKFSSNLVSHFKNYLRKIINPNYKFLSLSSDHIGADDDIIWSTPQYLSHEETKLSKLFLESNHTPSSLLLLVLNLLSDTQNIHVLDWGGGSGQSLFQIHRFLSSPSNISWTVVDNLDLQLLGRKFSNLHSIPINYSSSITDHPFNFLFINSVLQYVPYRSILPKLISSLPQYIFFQGLLATENMGSIILLQHLYGHLTRARFVDLEDFIEYISEYGYKLIYRSVNTATSNILLTNFKFPRSLRKAIYAEHLSYDLFFILDR